MEWKYRNVAENGQFVIPKKWREKLELGQVVEVVLLEDGIIIRKPKTKEVTA